MKDGYNFVIFRLALPSNENNTATTSIINNGQTKSSPLKQQNDGFDDNTTKDLPSNDIKDTSKTNIFTEYVKYLREKEARENGYVQQVTPTTNSTNVIPSSQNGNSNGESLYSCFKSDFSWPAAPTVRVNIKFSCSLVFFFRVLRIHILSPSFFVFRVTKNFVEVKFWFFSCCFSNYFRNVNSIGGLNFEYFV